MMVAVSTQTFSTTALLSLNLCKSGNFIIEQLKVNVHFRAVNVVVEVIIDLINNMSNNDPVRACADEKLVLDYCEGGSSVCLC